MWRMSSMRSMRRRSLTIRWTSTSRERRHRYLDWQLWKEKRRSESLVGRTYRRQKPVISWWRARYSRPTWWSQRQDRMWRMSSMRSMIHRSLSTRWTSTSKIARRRYPDWQLWKEKRRSESLVGRTYRRQKPVISWWRARYSRPTWWSQRQDRMWRMSSMRSMIHRSLSTRWTSTSKIARRRYPDWQLWKEKRRSESLVGRTYRRRKPVISWWWARYSRPTWWSQR